MNFKIVISSTILFDMRSTMSQRIIQIRCYNVIKMHRCDENIISYIAKCKNTMSVFVDFVAVSYFTFQTDRLQDRQTGEIFRIKFKNTAELTSVLDYCSCCHMIHIPGHHRLLRSRHHIPEAEVNKFDEMQAR